MNIAQVFRYYSDTKISSAILEHSRSREVVGVFSNGSFDKRPNTLLNPQDLPTLVRSGIVEFHCSLEHWKNPMAISLSNYSALRTGFDMVIDIDVESLQHAKLAAHVIFKSLREHQLESFGAKFSGGTGIHIIIPWQAIPQSINFHPTASLFPALARAVINYLKDSIREDLERALLSSYSPEQLAEQAKVGLSELLTETGIDPYKVVGLDSVLISARHLYRMPYSLNRNTFLASAPIDTNKILEFTTEQAKPENLDMSIPFIPKAQPEAAHPLILKALDWASRQKARKAPRKIDYESKEKILAKLFPPCINLILHGLSDGKKRALFILINFLSNMKWPYDEMEQLIMEWNQKNHPPLPESYVRGQLRYYKQRGKTPLPPNCSNEGYMIAIGVCKPDNTCRKITNPANYPYFKK